MFSCSVCRRSETRRRTTCLTSPIGSSGSPTPTRSVSEPSRPSGSAGFGSTPPGPSPYADLAGAIRAAAQPRANPPPTGAAAAADTNQRPRPSLDQNLQRAGPEVIGVAQRLRTLGDEVGVQVVQGPASLQLRDRLGAVVLLYPTYRSVEFVLEFGGRSGHEAEIGELRAALQQIADNARHL